MLACYVVNTSSEDDTGKKKCQPALEDYYECLHHRKEVGYNHHMFQPLTLPILFVSILSHLSRFLPVFHAQRHFTNA